MAHTLLNFQFRKKLLKIIPEDSTAVPLEQNSLELFPNLDSEDPAHPVQSLWDTLLCYIQFCHLPRKCRRRCIHRTILRQFYMTFLCNCRNSCQTFSLKCSSLLLLLAETLVRLVRYDFLLSHERSMYVRVPNLK